MPRTIAFPLGSSFGLSLGLVLIAASALPAMAQNGAPDSENGRYSFNRVEDGYLRLDQRTGQVSVCSRRDLGWACHPVPDERSALEDEIGRLQRDNANLKKEMIARGITPPGSLSQAPATREPAAKDSPREAPGKDPAIKTPTDAELDRAMAVMERLWKRLVEMVQRWQREMTPI